MLKLRNVSPCSQCNTLPELRRDESRGLFMPVCPACGHHSEPWDSLTGAVARWNRVNAKHRECLGCGGKPRMRHSRLRKVWAFQCTSCQHSLPGSHTVLGAVSAWHRHNTPNNGHYWMLWQQRQQELQAQRGGSHV